MTPEQVSQLPEYYGLYFDPESGHSYLADGTDTGFTFERARWSGPFNLHLDWPFLNPFDFATHESALKVLSIVRAVVPPHISCTLDETPKNFGPFTRTVQRYIVVNQNNRSEQYSAGALANSIIRNGVQLAGQSFLAELRLAGFTL
jgi:hypothetical protein